MPVNTFAVTNPATEEHLDDVRIFTPDEVTEAVVRAKDAQRTWAKLTLAARQSALYAMAEAVGEHVEELAQLESRDVGKPISSARAEAQSVAEVFRYYAGAIDKLSGDSIPLDGGMTITIHEPVGVVAVVTPWNFPLPIASWNVAPALAAGNSVVLKPASLTPLSSLRLGRIIEEVSPVPGLLQVVTGGGGTVGEALLNHPQVDKISFTGSTEVGRSVLNASAHDIKRVTLELGGKSANIVFADADISQAARSAPGAVFDNTGQDCCARSRILVQRDVLDEFLEEFIAATKALQVGDPADENTDLGPLVSSSHRDAVAKFLDDDGVEFIYQGDAPKGPGNWLAPHIGIDHTADSRCSREEIFGPIAVVIPFDTEDDAVRLANDTIYGLSGSIWTGDLGRAMRVARAVDSGTLAVNSNSSVRVQTPFGGFKQSGLGRELGMNGLRGYTELKSVFLSSE
ncbi:aldehyde dehydrogenase family protein [Brevibacterium sp. 'Marine']|uniref:aldehyde dehydrogenase family protein n=1 Tax=Brevibacterium sp. 'Marine' TaxID=2725563 RepID=UPI00145CC30C|nr:aldehyde dehydrogenase family protein [Brevibacterium sp. 'Marine']